MGMFKEQLKEFENFDKLAAICGGYFTVGGKYAGNEDQIEYVRDWMRDMSELRVGKERTNSQAKDSFFIAFEQDGNWLEGITLHIVTVKQLDGSKKIFFRREFDRQRMNVYEKYRSLNK